MFYVPPDIDANIHFTKKLLTGTDPVCGCGNAQYSVHAN